MEKIREYWRKTENYEEIIWISHNGRDVEGSV